MGPESHDTPAVAAVAPSKPAWSPRRSLALCHSGAAWLWSDGRLSRVHPDSVSCCFADEQLLVDRDYGLAELDNEGTRVWSGALGPIWCLASTRQHILGGVGAGWVARWSRSTRSLEQLYFVSEAPVVRVTSSADGRRVAAVDLRGHAFEWAAAEQTARAFCESAADCVYTDVGLVWLRADGTAFAGSSEDRSVFAALGASTLSASRDGHWLGIGDRVLHTASGKSAQLPGRASISPDGKLVATYGEAAGQPWVEVGALPEL